MLHRVRANETPALARSSVSLAQPTPYVPPVPRSLAVAALLALAPALAAQAQVPPGTVLDEIVAVVGGEIVLRSEVDALAYQATRGAAADDATWSRALDQLIDDRVLVAHAQRDTTIVVTDEQVRQGVEQRVAALAEQAGGEAQLAAGYGKPIESIRADLREIVRRELLAQQIQGRRMRDIAVTPGEVRQFFADIPEAERPEVPALVRVAHVVKRPAPDAAADARAREFTQALRDSILAGTPIEDLARRHSADPGSAPSGGLYERINLRDLVPEFGAVAGTLQPGGLSQVFKTQFGYHVLRLNTRQGDLASLNHILVRVDETAVDPSAAVAELAVLRDSVVAHGVPFEALARRHSDDPYSSSRGGYVVDLRTGERDLRLEALGPLWAATIDTMEVGEISAPAPVELLDGARAYHIVLLQRKTPPHALSLETDYALLAQYALQDKRQRELTAWLRELRGDVYVDVRTDRYRAAG